MGIYDLGIIHYLKRCTQYFDKACSTQLLQVIFIASTLWIDIVGEVGRGRKTGG
jgi:hypothetical protein